MARRCRGAGLVSAALIAACFVTTGCEVTPEKIQRWKETEKGPGKLREALRDDGLSPELRSQALTALVELGMVTEAYEDLKEEAETPRRALIRAAVGPLVSLAQGTSGKGAQAIDSTTRVMREAKDALYVLREMAAPEDRAKIDEALVIWITYDLAGRLTAGAHASDKIILAIGAPAGPRLADVIADPRTSEVSRRAAAELLGTVGDTAARTKAGAQLVEIARKEKTLQESTLHQMGLVGGDHAVAYLGAVAEDRRQPDAVREKALFALAIKAAPASLQMALTLASDRTTDGNVREAAFQLAERIGPSAVPGLARLLDDKEENTRWRAVEGVLTAGGAAAVSTVLEGLSPSRTYPKADVEDFLVRDITRVGPSALPALRAALDSESWIARHAAMLAIARIGGPKDAAALEALAGDKRRLKGWSDGATIGSEARRLAEELRTKRR